VVGGLRRAVMGTALALCAWAGVPQVAQAATTTTTTTTTPAPLSMSFAGTAADGTTFELGVHITDVQQSRLSFADSTQNAGAAGYDFLDLNTTTNLTAGTGPTFNAFPPLNSAQITLVLPDGTVVPSEPPGPQISFLYGGLAFIVPISTRSATLVVSPGTTSALEYPGALYNNAALTTVTFQPASLKLVVPPPYSSVPTTQPVVTQPVVATASPKKSRTALGQRRTTAQGLTTANAVEAGTGGGIVVLVLFIPIWRRRAYKKADREGRVIIVSPPVPVVPPALVATTGSPDADQLETEPGAASGGPSVVVKVLGPIEVEGLVQAFDLKPEQEVLVFLALHPGRRFTSTELRSRIWIEGRDEPTAGTFRNYLVALRKRLPPGTVIRTGLDYALTETVTSDWGRFCAVIEDHDDRAERLAEALDLVPGSPFEGAFSGRNAPYGWAGDLSHHIEAMVERAGHELATLGLDSGDLALADAGTARVLRCLPASVVARGDHLRLGSALGGPREVERRMRAARQALGRDVVLLEPLALSVGWVKV
jgi:hypothetical protein